MVLMLGRLLREKSLRVDEEYEVAALAASVQCRNIFTKFRREIYHLHHYSPTFTTRCCRKSRSQSRLPGKRGAYSSTLPSSSLIMIMSKTPEAKGL
jgi:hypothetical protein